MFVNTNTTSIQKASKYHSMLRMYRDDTRFEFSAEKNMFKIVYRHMNFQDGSEYSQYDSSEHFELDKKKFNSIVRFHVGLMLPKTKGNIINKVALEVTSKMRWSHDHSVCGYHGDYEDFSRYAISIVEMVDIVKNSIHIQEGLKDTEKFILSHV